MNTYQIISAFTIIFGLGSLLQTILISHFFKHKHFKIYLPLHILIILKQSLFLIMSSKQYNNSVILGFNFVNFLFLSALMVLGMLLQESLYKKNNLKISKKLYKRYIISITISCGLLILISSLINDIYYSYLVGLFYYSLFFVMLIRGFRLNNKNNYTSWFKRTKKLYIIIFAIIPFLILDEIFWQRIYPNLFYSPMMFYLFWNIVSSIFLILYIYDYKIVKNKRKYSDIAHLLTKREHEIVDELQKGLTYKEISEDLNVSLSTIKAHIYNIYQKYDVRNKIELLELLSRK